MSRDLILVVIATVAWGTGEGMFLYFEPLYLQELGADPVQIGAILGFVGVAMTVAHVPAGYLSDRLGRRPLLWSGWILGTLATLIMAVSNTLPAFIAGSALYGMTAYVLVPLNSYITAARGRWSVSRALTLMSAIFNFGAIIGPLLGGWIGDQVGLRMTFRFAAALFFSSTLVILFIRPQPVERPQSDKKKNGLQAVINPYYGRFLFVVFIAMFFMYLPQPLSPNFLQNERGINLTQIGQLIAARSLGIVVLSLILGQLKARSGFLLAQVFMGLFTLLIWRGSGFPWYFLGYLLLGGYQTARSLAIAQGRSLVEGSNMGLAYGMIETVISLAIILAPPIAGLLYATNPVLIYAISLGCIGLAAIITIRYTPVQVEQLA
jgi:MFS family permease